MEIFCPTCQSRFFLKKEQQLPQFCTFCGASLQESSFPSTDSSFTQTEISFIEGHAPKDEAVQFTIGPYQVLQSIGKGGMGEVLLAYDTSCGRRIALKRVRSDLEEKKILYQRFLKEARITSQLTHPAIIPIYAIHEEGNHIYYTMPYVEGQTLKEILRKTRRQEKKGEPLDHLGGSIPALIRVLITICNAIAYAHSKNVLHRDLKPENIIIGKFGEVMILDWGLAKIVNTPLLKQVSPKKPLKTLTHYRKVVGTVAYMAPERALGSPATIQTDIYSLGITLYMMLTLHQPFRRGGLKEFIKNMNREQFIDPIEIAPYRDVPKILAEICHKCLMVNPQDRYPTVEELINDLENFIEGRSEWFHIATLNIKKKSDWEFQENVLIAEHVAITRGTEVSDWMSLMISQASFSENIKILAKVRIGEKGNGIGFLLNIPEGGERKHVNDGYCLWLGSENQQSTKLLRSTVEVLSLPDIALGKNKWHLIEIEKVDNHLQCFVDGSSQFSYVGHIPVIGTRVGLVARDADFEIEDFFIYIGGQTVSVSCLAVPDAFLAHKDYDTALYEYRRIGQSFRGRAEGREALFRAGVALLEKAKLTKLPEYFDQALDEFSKLHGTPGAPLEYIGKALVYQALDDFEEEIKCYYLACRRYPRHPLFPILRDHIITRMHECSRSHRRATYHLILLAVTHLPDITSSPQPAKLFTSLKNHWEKLPFMEEDPTCRDQKDFAIHLAFWLGRPFYLLEMIDHLVKMTEPDPILLDNAFYSLIELGAFTEAKTIAHQLKSQNPLHHLLSIDEKGLEKAFADFLAKETDFSKFANQRVLFYFLDCAIDQQNTQFAEAVNHVSIPENTQKQIDAHRAWLALLANQKELAGQILQQYPYEMLSQETSIFYFLYGCWLLVTEGPDIANVHLSGILDVSYPRSWALGTHYINGKITNEQRWFHQSFLWERRQLYRQLTLYYHCLEDRDLMQKYQHLRDGERLSSAS